MPVTDRDELTIRYAKAIWKSCVEAGECSTPWPGTRYLEDKLLSAAAAAVGVMGRSVQGLNYFEHVKMPAEIQAFVDGNHGDSEQTARYFKACEGQADPVPYKAKVTA